MVRNNKKTNSVPLGDKIKRIRETKRLTQEHVANELDIAVKTYRGIENNINDPSYLMLNKIADFFGITLIQLIQDSEQQLINNVFNQNSGNKGHINMHQHTNENNPVQSNTQLQVIENLKSENIYLKSVVDKLLEEKKK